MTSAGFVRAKSRRLFAVSTGSPVTNAMAVGPARSFSSMAVTPASLAAMAVRVFLTTAYVACPPMLFRSWVSCDTVRPRYSVRTAAFEVRNLSEISATAAALSGLAMALLPSFVVPVEQARTRRTPRRRAHGAWENRPGSGHTEPQHDTCHSIPFHLRGPPAGAGPWTTLAGGDRRSLADDQGT